MRRLEVSASSRYEVCIEGGLLNRSGVFLREVFSPCKTAIVTDEVVDALYGEALETSLRDEGFSVVKYVFPHGEGSKNFSTLQGILDFLVAEEVTRSDVLVTLGGGVPGDIGGFAAAIYLRGIPFVQVPTSLLAMVDSSVGGKTAVDLPGGKNLAGAFHQPALVLCDPEVLGTLPQGELENGLAEAVKYGVLKDRELFSQLALGTFSSFEGKVEEFSRLIETCVAIKRDLVAEDEFDRGSRQLLNLGHTLGHGIESLSDFSLSHGRAVSLGMVLAAKAGEGKGITKPGLSREIGKALLANGLPVSTSMDPHEVAARALSDKKRRGDTIQFVFPKTIGQGVLYPVKLEELEEMVAKAMEGL